MTDRCMHIELQDKRAALESMPDISSDDTLEESIRELALQIANARLWEDEAEIE